MITRTYVVVVTVDETRFGEHQRFTEEELDGQFADAMAEWVDCGFRPTVQVTGPDGAVSTFAAQTQSLGLPGADIVIDVSRNVAIIPGGSL